METAGSDFKKVRRLLLYALVLFVVFNHTVRILAAKQFGEVSWLNWTTTIGTSTILSLDKFRRACGDTFQKSERICPSSAEGYCHLAVGFVREGLGM